MHGATRVNGGDRVTGLTLLPLSCVDKDSCMSEADPKGN